MKEKINEILDSLVDLYILDDERQEVVTQLLELVEEEYQRGYEAGKSKEHFNSIGIELASTKK